MKKTWASELAIGLLVGWVFLTGYIFLGLEADVIGSYESIYNNITITVLSAVFATLGFKRHVEAGLVRPDSPPI